MNQLNVQEIKEKKKAIKLVFIKMFIYLQFTGIQFETFYRSIQWILWHLLSRLLTNDLVPLSSSIKS